MIQQLVNRRAKRLNPVNPDFAAVGQEVLTADPLDLLLHMEQVWDAANVYASTTPGNQLPVPQARQTLWSTGLFAVDAPPRNDPVNFSPQPPAWDHLGYAFALENTRAAQILRRVVRAFRGGEALGIPSISTQRWLDTTESLVYGTNLLTGLLGTSTVRPDPEAMRRNAYWRLFSMDLAFGTDVNARYPFDRADATNRNFVDLFETLLNELWRAIENLRNTSGANPKDDDRIFRLAEQLMFILRSRRQIALLSREELAASTAMGWLELTVSANTSVVEDLRAEATSAGDRLRMIGERVGLAPHSKAPSFFSMATDLSILLRAIEAGWVDGPERAALLYDDVIINGVQAIGPQSRRVISEWTTASGRDLKSRSLPIDVRPRALVRSR